MNNSWTPERRARQAEMIQIWKPWQQSTGPITREGKTRSSRNAYTGKGWRELRKSIVNLNRLMKTQRENINVLKAE